jgi:hypothetical protein
MMRNTDTGFDWIELRLKHNVWLMYCGARRYITQNIDEMVRAIIPIKTRYTTNDSHGSLLLLS